MDSPIGLKSQCWAFEHTLGGIEIFWGPLPRQGSRKQFLKIVDLFERSFSPLLDLLPSESLGLGVKIYLHILSEYFKPFSVSATSEYERVQGRQGLGEC